MRKWIFVLSLIAYCVYSNTLFSQALWDVLPPLPDAITAKAPLPAGEAALMAKLEVEKKQKLASVNRPNVSVNQVLSNDLSKYVSRSGNAWTILIPNGNYTMRDPYMEITNSSLCNQRVDWNTKKPAIFNPKKDYLQNVYLSSKNEITVINHKLRNCDMSAFRYAYDSTYFHIENNKIIFDRLATEVLTGDCPSELELYIIHPESGQKFKLKIGLSFRESKSCLSEHHAVVVAAVQNVFDESMAAICDLEELTVEYVYLPYLFNANGRNGSNGRKGSNGINGINEINYTDKNGKEHHISGTCADKGQDGGDGENGGNGGMFLVCISPQMIAANGLNDITVMVEAGLGGKGGKGGKGGIHGKGSGCTGNAADGKDGQDGHDGTRGDFLFVEADTNAFFQQILPYFPAK